MGMLEKDLKKKKKRTNASIFKKKTTKKQKRATLQRMKISCATFRTLGLNSVVLFCLTFLCSVLMLISWTI